MLNWLIPTIHAIAICICIDILLYAFCKEKINILNPKKSTLGQKVKVWLVLIFMCSIPVFRWFIVIGLAILFLFLFIVPTETLYEHGKKLNRKSGKASDDNVPD